MNIKQETKKGFTLLEMMVALGVFSIVMFIAVTALFTTVAAHRKARSVQSVVQNVEFAVDSIVRGIRTGTQYHCGGESVFAYDVALSCPTNPASEIAFEKNNGKSTDPTDQVVYRLQGTTVERSIDGGNSFSAVTSPQVTVEIFDFYVFGAAPGDSTQPRVLLVMEGLAGSPQEKTETRFKIQTTITQRLLDS